MGVLLAVALAAPPEVVPMGLDELAAYAAGPRSRKKLAQVERSLASDDPGVRAVAATVLYADDPERWGEAFATELAVRNAAAKAEGRVEMLSPAEVQSVSFDAAASLSKDAPGWLRSCLAFVQWRERAAYVATPSETIDVVRLYRRDCVDGAWDRQIEKGQISPGVVLDALDAKAR